MQSLLASFPFSTGLGTSLLPSRVKNVVNSLLQTKTADMYSKYGNFHKCDQALIPLFGQDLGTRLGLGLHTVNTLEVD